MCIACFTGCHCGAKRDVRDILPNNIYIRTVLCSMIGEDSLRSSIIEFKGYHLRVHGKAARSFFFPEILTSDDVKAECSCAHTSSISYSGTDDTIHDSSTSNENLSSVQDSTWSSVDSQICDVGKEKGMENEASSCSLLCYSDTNIAWQPKGKQTLVRLMVKVRNFQPQWYKHFPWLNVCMSTKVYCICYRYAMRHKLITFSSKSRENTFSEKGYQNWCKAVAKFSSHSISHAHAEVS